MSNHYTPFIDEPPGLTWFQRLRLRLRLWLFPVRFKRCKTPEFREFSYRVNPALRDIILGEPQMRDVEDREIDSRFIFEHKDNQ